MEKMQKTGILPDADVKRRENIVRFGLMTIPIVAWTVAFAELFLVANGFRQDWIGTALIPSLIEALVVGIVCAMVWFAYKRYLIHAP